jgi:hypothetical protein
VVDAIRTRHSAEVRWGDGAASSVTATSVEVFPYADPDTHSFNVRLTLPAGMSGLYPGMTVKVAFATGEVKRLLVPASDVVQRGELVGVYVVDDHGVVLRQVRTGNRDGDQVEVLAGLDDGERVATDPQAARAYLEKQHAEGAATHE